jgi:hypothetical protein
MPIFFALNFVLIIAPKQYIDVIPQCRKQGYHAVPASKKSANFVFFHPIQKCLFFALIFCYDYSAQAIVRNHS